MGARQVPLLLSFTGSYPIPHNPRALPRAGVLFGLYSEYEKEGEAYSTDRFEEGSEVLAAVDAALSLVNDYAARAGGDPLDYFEIQTVYKVEDARNAIIDQQLGVQVRVRQDVNVDQRQFRQNDRIYIDPYGGSIHDLEGCADEGTSLELLELDEDNIANNYLVTA